MPAPLDIRILSNLSPPDWWSIGLTSAAALLGAIIGAGISYLVARQTANEGRRAAQDALRESEKLATYRVGLKLMEIVNAAAGYHLGAERHIADTKRLMANKKLETWLVMKAFLGRPMEINIDANDLVVFWRANALAYVTRFLFLVSSYNAMIYAVEAYAIRRDALMDKMSPEQ